MPAELGPGKLGFFFVDSGCKAHQNVGQRGDDCRKKCTMQEI